MDSMFFKEALAGVRVTYFSRRFSEELNILRRGIMLAEYSHYRLIRAQENWTRPAMIRTRASQYAHTNTQTLTNTHSQNFVMIMYACILSLSAWLKHYCHSKLGFK